MSSTSGRVGRKLLFEVSWSIDQWYSNWPVCVQPPRSGKNKIKSGLAKGAERT